MNHQEQRVRKKIIRITDVKHWKETAMPLKMKNVTNGVKAFRKLWHFWAKTFHKNRSFRESKVFSGRIIIEGPRRGARIWRGWLQISTFRWQGNYRRIVLKKLTRKISGIICLQNQKNKNQSKKLKSNENRKSHKQKHLKPIPLPEESDSSEDDSSIQGKAAMVDKSLKCCSPRPSSSLNVVLY